MKRYDFAKAKKLIDVEIGNGLVCASLGMHEDWFYTAETIWEDGEYQKQLPDNAVERMNEYCEKRANRAIMREDLFAIMQSFEDVLIGGICESCWATPVLQLEYSDKDDRTINCYVGDSENNGLGINCLGVLSEPVQEHRKTIELEG